MVEIREESVETQVNDSSNVGNTTATDNATEQPAAAAAAAEAPQSGWAMAKGFIFRMLIMYAFMSFFKRSPTPQATDTGPDGQPPSPISKIPGSNLFSDGTKFDLYFYLSEFVEQPDFDDDSSLFWRQNGLVFGDWTAGPTEDSTFTKSTTFKASKNLLSNSSMYLHTYMLPKGWSPNPADKGKYGKSKTIHKVKQLNKFKRRKFVSTSNLLTGKTDIHPDLVQKENGSTLEILSHWHPNISVNLIFDQTPFTQGAVPPPLDEYIEFVTDTDGMPKYYPVVFYNDYWNLQTDYMPINETTPELNFTLTVYPLSLMKWQFYAAQGMRKSWYANLLGDSGEEQSDQEQDSLKQTLLDTNPYLLALTMTVSIIHSVFEFLAFKNDIQFWRERKSMEGLSVRSVFFNVFQSFIVLLYIIDNETNFIVMVSVFVGLVIDGWKIFKVVDIKLDYEDKWFDSIPRIVMKDKSTYVESETKKYDQLAFRYLSWVLFPLLAGYGVYSLLYNEHKGWYSWVLNMLYGFLLMFGFIMMTPQLFINYKLKSVAHLPWRMMTYKALNTFIDDLFAFVIKMPTLYRIGCFRDDVVFLIFLYQRWIYKVDPTRVNEFGTTGEDKPENGQPPVDDGATEEDKSVTDKKKD